MRARTSSLPGTAFPWANSNRCADTSYGGVLLDTLELDFAAARAYGRVYAATRAHSRKPHGARVIDLLIASVAIAEGLPLYTRNPRDFEHRRGIGLDIYTV